MERLENLAERGGEQADVGNDAVAVELGRAQLRSLPHRWPRAAAGGPEDLARRLWATMMWSETPTLYMRSGRSPEALRPGRAPAPGGGLRLGAAEVGPAPGAVVRFAHRQVIAAPAAPAGPVHPVLVMLAGVDLEVRTQTPSLPSLARAAGDQGASVCICGVRVKSRRRRVALATIESRRRRGGAPRIIGVRHVARVEYPDLSRGSGEQRALAAQIEAERGGKMLNLYRMLLHSPDDRGRVAALPDGHPSAGQTRRPDA